MRGINPLYQTFTRQSKRVSAKEASHLRNHELADQKALARRQAPGIEVIEQMIDNPSIFPQFALQYQLDTDEQEQVEEVLRKPLSSHVEERASEIYEVIYPVGTRCAIRKPKLRGEIVEYERLSAYATIRFSNGMVKSLAPEALDFDVE
jgi:hypothetical protein